MIQSPTYPYWHVYTDQDGISRQKQCFFTQFTMKSIEPPAAPQWIGQEYEDLEGFLITVQPAGWIGEWHENPAPQWIICLSGRWFVETMDQVRVEYGPGELCLGEDQGTILHNGKKGHLSGTVGDKECVLMQVRFKSGHGPQTCPFI